MRFMLLSILLLVISLVGAYSWLWYQAAREPIEWVPYSSANLARELKRGETVLVNFRATWDLMSVKHEVFALETPEVRRWIRFHDVVPMQADYTDGSAEIRDAIASLRRLAIPIVAIYPASAPHKPIVISDDITKEKVLEALEEADR